MWFKHMSLAWLRTFEALSALDERACLKLWTVGVVINELSILFATEFGVATVAVASRDIFVQDEKSFSSKSLPICSVRLGIWVDTRSSQFMVAQRSRSLGTRFSFRTFSNSRAWTGAVSASQSLSLFWEDGNFDSLLSSFPCWQYALAEGHFFSKFPPSFRFLIRFRFTSTIFGFSTWVAVSFFSRKTYWRSTNGYKKDENMK